MTTYADTIAFTSPPEAADGPHRFPPVPTHTVRLPGWAPSILDGPRHDPRMAIR